MEDDVQKNEGLILRTLSIVEKYILYSPIYSSPHKKGGNIIPLLEYVTQ
jgi:hypothetical protein